MANGEFYERVALPFNDEDPNFEFVNDVIASEHFVRLQHLLSKLTERIKDLANEVHNLEIHRNRATREIQKIRKVLFARNYSRITKSADKEIQDAFIFLVASEAGDEILSQLSALEDEVENITREIEIRQPRLNEYRNDMKLIEKVGDYVKQYLDAEKLRMKIENNVS